MNSIVSTSARANTSRAASLARRGAQVLLATCAAFLFAFPGLSDAREGADPGINRPYLDPDFAQWVERFESPGREVYDRRMAILSATGVKPGMRIADIGAGTGLFTLLFARAVGPAGVVHAVDISPTFAANIQRRAQSERLANVTTVVNSQTDVRLAPTSIDLAFVCDTYHHFEEPAPMLASIRRALRPNGTLIVVDYERIEGRSSGWVLGHVRAGKAGVIREIEAAGFHLAADEKLLTENFVLRFVRLASDEQR
jgi:ubiquinone/menaquinone biosynthesis C-methylase UbiE